MTSRANEVSPTSTTGGVSRKPLVRQTRAVSRMKSISEGAEISPVKDEKKAEGDETAESGGATGDSVQRNLSLEALFQVTHSELKNIRKEDDPNAHGVGGANGETKSPEPATIKQEGPKEESNRESAASPLIVQLQPVEPLPGMQPASQEASPSKELIILRAPEDEDMVIDERNVRAATPQQVQICVEVASTEPVMEVEMPDSSPEGKHTVVKLPVSGKGIEKYQLKSDSLEEQGLKLTYTKKTYDQYEPNPIGYGTYKPRSYKPTTPQVSTEGTPTEPGQPQGGRKRKYPAKPGRHICPYCGRGCAKPSVLQKHIRAHTGERPYPCGPCGFSFKTKSNLYKHCKSRAHAIKAGLSPNIDDSQKDLNKSREESFGDEDLESDDLSDGDDGRTSDSSTRNSSRSTSVETNDIPHSAGSSFDSMRSKSKDELPSLSSSDSKEGDSEKGTSIILPRSNGSPQIVQGSRVYRTDKQYFDIKPVDGKPESPVTVPVGEKGAATFVKAATLKRPAPGMSPLAVPEMINVTSVIQQESDNSMKVTINYPKVTKQQAISFDQNVKMSKSLSVGNLSTSNFRRSASLPEHPNLKQSASPSGADPKDVKVVTAEEKRERLLNLRSIPPKATRDHKNMTPEMVGEHISQLISNNAALLDIPMADAPRPKRMSRQNSQTSEALSSQRGILSPSLSLDAASNRAIFQGQGRAKSMDVKLGSDSSSSTVTYLQAQDTHTAFLPQTEPTDQPPGESSESQMMAELVAAAKTATPVASVSLTSNTQATPPQEFKIQIKLPKAATTDASVVPSLPTSQAAMSTLVLPEGNQPYIGQPGVLLPAKSQMLVRQLSMPISQQQAPDSSVIRELLLKGQKEGAAKVTTTSATTVPTAPPPTIQMVEVRPDGSTSVINDFAPVIVVDNKGTPATTYVTPVTQDPVAMNVAQDVEVIATSEGFQVSPRAPLKRAMSLPQGLPTASSSASPYGNVIFDNYDPKAPPKRGRPKGSKNRVREQLSLNIPSYSVPNSGTSPAVFTSTLRMPFLTTQASSSTPASAPVRPSLRLTIPQPAVIPSVAGLGTPVLSSTPGVSTSQVETPTAQSLTKLKLKGKLLMKRSMSVERMLSQEREKLGTSIDESLPSTPVQGISSPAVISRSNSKLLTPTSYVTNPLVRTASADEATPLKKRRAAFMHSAKSEDSPIRRLLGHSSADSVLQSFSASTEALPVNAGSCTPAALTATTASRLPMALSFDSTDKLLRSPSLNRQDSIPVIPMNVPAKLSPLSVMVSTPPTIVVSRGTAPTNQYQPFNHQQQPFMAPLLQLSRLENQHLPQSLFLSIKLSPNASNIAIRTPSDDKDSLKGSIEKKSIDRVDSIVESDQKQRGELEKKLSGSEGGSMDSTGSGTPSLTDKGIVKVLVMGHQCPTLRMLTHTTFCTLAKPQPMYVPQETSKSLSMYSNWRSARFNPNPIGLSSRDLMSLYHLKTYTNDPYFTSPTMGPSKTGVLTHSSYWNYYNKMKSLQKAEDNNTGEEDVRIIKQVPEVKMATGVRIAEEEEKVILQTSAAPSVAMETVVVTTPAVAKPKSKEPKRCKIFAGGYKTNEEYIYIRGRGRGKYVCEECGIRCKKPSMLRKHIRTHTDVRPYLCKHCSFSFKTKGNLTKHMKSKAHQKKCIELGIIPVPIIVDESQIDAEALALQAQMAKDGRAQSEDDDGQFMGEDEEEDDDEEAEEDDDEEGQETMVVVDALTGEVRETIKCRVVRKDSEGPHYVAIQEGDKSQPTLVKIDAKTQAVLMQQAKASKQQKSMESADGEAAGQDDGDNDQPRPSIDKEIAHSLLDLSKSNEPKKSRGTISLETRRLLRQHSSHAAEEKEKEKKEENKDAEDPDGKAADGTRLDSLIGALMSRTKTPGDGSTSKPNTSVEAGHMSAPMSVVRMATTIYQSSVPTTRTQSSTSDLQHIHRRSQATYAQKIAALQTANENDLRLTLSRSRVNTTGSGFVPPLLIMELEGSQQPSGSNTSPTSATTKHLLRRQASIGGLSEDKEDKPTESEQVVKMQSEEHPVNLSMEKEEGPEKQTSVSVSEQPMSTTTSSPTAASVASTSTESASGSDDATQIVLDAPPIEKDGKYTCPFCDKVFSEFAQYAYHKNIHYIERTYRCDECSLAFRTKAHLRKHLRSEVHQNKQNVNQQYGTPSSDNPRPFKCDDCKIAFRIYGHLAKHNRSKSHIMVLQKLGKTAPEQASAGSDIEVLDEDESIEIDDDIEVAQATTKGQNIDTALKDPENILQPRETTPVPQEVPQTTTTTPVTTSASQEPTAAEGLEAEQFHYHKLGDYEKDLNASNEKVTVEKIKMEPIDIGTFSSLGTRTEGEAERFPPGGENDTAAERVARNREVFRHQAGSGSGEQHPHKCGICGRTFKAISTLKQHLVTHAELRPYVCEYCDAGFTTAQSLKFHLRTHTQERPYICGQCGDTFAGSEHLRQHMHQCHEDGCEDIPSPKPPMPAAAAAVANTPLEPTQMEVVPVSIPPVTLTTVSPPFPSIKPRLAGVQTLRPVQGQLLRSASADVVRDIRPKVSETTTQVLLSDVNPTARRRMNFTSSLSLPLQSGAVQLVPMMQQGGEQHIQLLQQPLNVVRMPMISLPIQNAANQPGFGGQLQTVLAPSTTVQTFMLQSPMVLQSMPVLQPNLIATPTQSTNSVTTPIMTTPTITITTPTKVTVNADDTTGNAVSNDPSTSEPVLIPTVVFEKEEEDGLKHVVSQELPITPGKSQNVPVTVRLDSQTSIPELPATPTQTVDIKHMLSSPVITVTPPDGKTVTEHMPTPMPLLAPRMSLISNPVPQSDEPVQEALQESGIDISQASIVSAAPPHIFSSTTYSTDVMDSRAVEESVSMQITSQFESAEFSTPTITETMVTETPSMQPVQQPIMVESVVTTSSPPTTNPSPMTGSRGLATKLIPGDDKAQEELIRALEQQGLSPDKVQVLQVKGENDDHTQFVIIECDGSNKLDERMIADLIQQNKVNAAPQPAMEPVAATPQPVPATQPFQEQQALVHMTSESEVCNRASTSKVLSTDSFDLNSGGTVLSHAAANARRGILKRQHSIDLADQSAGARGVPPRRTHTTDSSPHEVLSKELIIAEPPAKVRVTETSNREQLPLAVTTIENS